MRARTQNLLGLTLQAPGGAMLNGDALALPLWRPRLGARWNTRLMMVESDRLATPIGMEHREDKRSIKSLDKYIGDSMSVGSARASKSIDNYIKKLQTEGATNGMSTRESELYTLALKGASRAQLDAADSGNSRAMPPQTSRT